jgi:hypothetical protein
MVSSTTQLSNAGSHMTASWNRPFMCCAKISQSEQLDGTSVPTHDWLPHCRSSHRSGVVASQHGVPGHESPTPIPSPHSGIPQQPSPAVVVSPAVELALALVLDCDPLVLDCDPLALLGSTLAAEEPDSADVASDPDPLPDPESLLESPPHARLTIAIATPPPTRNKSMRMAGSCREHGSTAIA